VLDVSLGADFETYAIAAVVCALAGFFTLVASAMMAVGRRRAVAM
jgi:hypothetical protein